MCDFGNNFLTASCRLRISVNRKQLLCCDLKPLRVCRSTLRERCNTFFFRDCSLLPSTRAIEPTSSPQYHHSTPYRERSTRNCPLHSSDYPKALSQSQSHSYVLPHGSRIGRSVSRFASISSHDDHLQTLSVSSVPILLQLYCSPIAAVLHIFAPYHTSSSQHGEGDKILRPARGPAHRFRGGAQEVSMLISALLVFSS